MTIQDLKNQRNDLVHRLLNPHVSSNETAVRLLNKKIDAIDSQIAALSEESRPQKKKRKVKTKRMLQRHPKRTKTKQQRKSRTGHQRFRSQGQPASSPSSPPKRSRNTNNGGGKPPKPPKTPRSKTTKSKAKMQNSSPIPVPRTNVATTTGIEQQLFARTFAIHNTKRKRENIAALLRAWSQATVNQQIRKNSPHHLLIEKIKSGLQALCNNMNTSEKVTVTLKPPTVEALAKVLDKDLLQAVKLLKTYIGWFDRSPDKGKTLTWLKKAQNIENLPTVYTKQLNKAMANVSRYRQGAAKVNIVSTELSGLGSIGMLDLDDENYEDLEGLGCVEDTDCGCSSKKKVTRSLTLHLL